MPTSHDLPVFDSLALTVEQHIAEIHLSQPQSRNSLGDIFWREFPLLLDHIAQRSDVRVVVLHGDGPHFCSGIDLGFIRKLLATGGGDDGRARDRISTRIRQLQGAFLQLERLPVPVIAAIHGGAIGAGLELACTADIRLCSADAFFQLMEVQVAVVADLGGLQRLSRQVPTGIARELAYSGRRFAATEALSWGLVNAVHPDRDSLLAAARALAAQIAANSPLTVKYVKESLVAEDSAAIERELRQASIIQVAYGLGGDLDKALEASRRRETAAYDPLVKPE